MQTVNFLQSLPISTPESVTISLPTGAKRIDLSVASADAEVVATVQSSSDGATFANYGGPINLLPATSGYSVGSASVIASGMLRTTAADIVAVKVTLNSPNGGVAFVGSEVK